MPKTIDDVRIPADAVLKKDGLNIGSATTDLLHDLNLWATDTESEAASGGSGTFGGVPQSVALIESTASSVAKWWAAGGAALIIGAWGWVESHWSALGVNQAPVIWAVGIVTAALVLAIGHLLATDLHGRATAAAATINARARLADQMIVAATSAAAHGAVVPLERPLVVRRITEGPADRPAWLALAMRANGNGKLDVLVHKDVRSDWVPEGDIAV